MLSFLEWSNEKTFSKWKKKGKKNEQSASQGSTEVGNVNQQGQTDRNDQEVQSTVVYYFPEP